MKRMSIARATRALASAALASAASLAAALALPAAASPSDAPSGTALVITGAAARIPQEAALIQRLDERGELKDLVFISGDSSGALNAVALNAIRSGRMTWRRYREILSGMRDEDIFVRGKRAIPVDTSPLRATLERVVVGEMGFSTMGELPVPTSLSVTKSAALGARRVTYRLASERINAESDPSLPIVDVLMASTAIPLVFPEIRLAGAPALPAGEYIDGGAADDFVPIQALLQFERFRGSRVARVFIISRKTDSVAQLSEELRGLGINDHRVFDKLGISFDRITSRKFDGRLAALARRDPELAARTSVWKPDFPETFLLFDFGSLGAQYAATEKWALLHDPEPLDLFLSGASARARVGARARPRHRPRCGNRRPARSPRRPASGSAAPRRSP
jgi:predicted acylesterase/phospholipase RssA